MYPTPCKARKSPTRLGTAGCDSGACSAVFGGMQMVRQSAPEPLGGASPHSPRGWHAKNLREEARFSRRLRMGAEGRGEPHVSTTSVASTAPHPMQSSGRAPSAYSVAMPGRTTKTRWKHVEARKYGVCVRAPCTYR